MSEDRLLSDLGQLAREREAEEAARLDERWDRLSHGALSPEEEAELRALAESSPEAHEAYEAFRPLGPDFQAGVVQKLQQARAKEEEEPPPGRVLPFRRLTARVAGWGSLAAAVAAAVLVVLIRILAPALPDYEPLQVTGVSDLRGGEGGPDIPSAAPGGLFTVPLRPRTEPPAGQRLEAGCFLSRGGEVRRMKARSKPDPGGSVLMHCAVPADVPPGDWTLWAVVGRPGDLPGPEELRSQAGGEVRRWDWVALSKEVRIRPRGE
jgi:hypothetical protein